MRSGAPGKSERQFVCVSLSAGADLGASARAPPPVRPVLHPHLLPARRLAAAPAAAAVLHRPMAAQRVRLRREGGQVTSGVKAEANVRPFRQEFRWEGGGRRTSHDGGRNPFPEIQDKLCETNCCPPHLRPADSRACYVISGGGANRCRLKQEPSATSDTFKFHFRS